MWTSNLGLPELKQHAELEALLEFASEREYQFVLIGPVPIAQPLQAACGLPTFAW